MWRLTKSQCGEGGLPKKERRHGQFAELRGGGGLARKRRVMFLREGGGGYPNAHYEPVYTIK